MTWHSMASDLASLGVCILILIRGSCQWVHKVAAISLFLGLDLDLVWLVGRHSLGRHQLHGFLSTFIMVYMCIDARQTVNRH